MKTKFSKILSSLLILSFLISMFSVFSFTVGAEEDSADEESEYTLFINRSFDEGWNYLNGLFNTSSNNKTGISIDYEESITGDYNYFTRFEALVDDNDTYLEFRFGQDAVPPGVDPVNTVVEFSIKADDAAKLGTIVYLKTQLKSEPVRLIYIDGEQNIIALPGTGPDAKGYTLGKLENKWVNIAFSFDCSETGKIKGKMHYGTGEGYQYNKDIDIPLTETEGGSISTINFGIPVDTTSKNDRTGGRVQGSLSFNNTSVNGGYQKYYSKIYLIDVLH